MLFGQIFMDSIINFDSIHVYAKYLMRNLSTIYRLSKVPKGSVMQIEQINADIDTHLINYFNKTWMSGVSQPLS